MPKKSEVNISLEHKGKIYQAPDGTLWKLTEVTLEPLATMERVGGVITVDDKKTAVISYFAKFVRLDPAYEIPKERKPRKDKGIPRKKATSTQAQPKEQQASNGDDKQVSDPPATGAIATKGLIYDGVDDTITLSKPVEISLETAQQLDKEIATLGIGVKKTKV